MLAVLKGAPKFAFPAGTSAQDTSALLSSWPMLTSIEKAGGEMHSPLAAASPFAPAENTAVVLVPQELHTSTLYSPTLSKKFALMACWQQLSKKSIYVYVCAHIKNQCLSLSFLTNLLFTKFCGGTVMSH